MIVALILYLIISDYDYYYKKRLMFTIIMFMIYGYFSEVHLIKKTGILNYDKTKYNNVPDFLPLIYAYWAIFVTYLFNLSDYLLKQ